MGPVFWFSYCISRDVQHSRRRTKHPFSRFGVRCVRHAPPRRLYVDIVSTAAVAAVMVGVVLIVAELCFIYVCNCIAGAAVMSSLTSLPKFITLQMPSRLSPKIVVVVVVAADVVTVVMLKSFACICYPGLSEKGLFVGARATKYRIPVSV